jgi:ketosteroid isomerase-like protein
MRKLLLCLLVAVLPGLAQGAHHETEAEILALAEAFNTAYATNKVDAYFSFYAQDAELYFFGARQDIAAYKKEWQALMAAGGGVEKNTMSDIKIQVMPGGNVAVLTSFVDNQTRDPDTGLSTAKAFETDVWRKMDGIWKIVTLHYSELPPEA